MSKTATHYRALRSFICPQTARDWRKAAADRTDPTIERISIAAGELITPPCAAALASWLANDLVEEVSTRGRSA